MKKIYMEITEDEYTLAKEIGFFEVTDFLRTRFREFLRANKEHSYVRKSNTK